MIKTIDLSVELAHHMPRYPSPYLPEVEITPAATHKEHGRSAQIIRFGSHVSTHIDAPFHAIPDGKTIEQLPLSQFVGRARILRIPKKDKDTPLDRNDFEGIKGIKDIQKMILDTTWAKRTWGTKEYFTEGPYLTRDAAHFLADLPNLHLIGMDFPNIDSKHDTKMGTPNPNHQILLGREIVLLENLINLEFVDEDFYLSSPPVKWVGGDGSVCRAVAIFPLEELAQSLNRS